MTEEEMETMMEVTEDMVEEERTGLRDSDTKEEVDTEEVIEETEMGIKEDVEEEGSMMEVEIEEEVEEEEEVGERDRMINLFLCMM